MRGSRCSQCGGEATPDTANWLKWRQFGAARPPTIVGMELTQIELEAINAAHSEGSVDPGSFAKILLLDMEGTRKAFAFLEQRRLMQKDEDGRFSLTKEGEALYHRREAQASASVKRRTPTWQPR